MENILEKEDNRLNRNRKLFLALAPMVGMTYVLGYDTLSTYLYSNPVTKSIAEGFGTLFGLGSLLAAFIVLLLAKIGYKKVVIIGVAFSSVIPLSALYMSTNQTIITLSVLIMSAGLTVFTVLVGPFVMAYTNNSNRDQTFSKVMYFFQSGFVVSALIGGPAIVLRFAQRMGIPYSEAQELSTNVVSFTQDQLNAYLLAHKDIMLFVIITGIIQLIIALKMNEKKEDYHVEKADKPKFRKVMTKKVVIWLSAILVLLFAGGFFIPYVNMYLTEIGMPRSYISQVTTFDKLLSVIFLMLSPMLIKKLGKINTLMFSVLAAIPFLLFIGLGASQLPGGVMMVAIALVFRSGFYSASEPIQSSLGMEFVDRSFRHVYASILFIINSITMIVAGALNQLVIFPAGGFQLAYIISGVLYSLFVVLVFIFFRTFKSSTELGGHLDA